jgi:hypothetical protein
VDLSPFALRLSKGLADPNPFALSLSKGLVTHARLRQAQPERDRGEVCDLK